MSDRKAAERRRGARVKKRHDVRYGPGDLAHTGYTDDVSDSGIHLKASVLYPPRTVLVLQIDYPEKAVTLRGVVRWIKEAPPAAHRRVRGAMGIEFSSQIGLAAPAAPAVETPAPAKLPERSKWWEPPRGSPIERTEEELAAGATQRRQVSTSAGNTYEILLTEYRGAFYARLYQLPRSDGSAEAVFRAVFWRQDEAEKAVKGFLKEH